MPRAGPRRARPAGLGVSPVYMRSGRPPGCRDPIETEALPANVPENEVALFRYADRTPAFAASRMN
jgi:hypothetical protein